MVEALSSEKSIFLQALEITSVIERAAYLDAACKGNAELRAGVDSLLQAHEKRQGLLDAAEFATAAVLPPFIGEGHGPVIGPYKLLQQIGEGGMGTVYMAEQTCVKSWRRSTMLNLCWSQYSLSGMPLISSMTK